MNMRSEEDAVIQDSQTEDSGISENNLPKGFHGFMMRHMGHQDVTPSSNKRKRPLPVIPILLISMVALHILAASFLSKTGSAAFSFNNPTSYGMIGLLVVFVMSKLISITKFKQVLGFIRRKENQSAQGITNCISSTSSA